MPSSRLTHNAVLGFHRAVCPEESISGAYHRLSRALETARISILPPGWLHQSGASNDGYLLLAEDSIALPLRHGRAVSCLVDPTGAFHDLKRV